MSSSESDGRSGAAAAASAGAASTSAASPPGHTDDDAVAASASDSGAEAASDADLADVWGSTSAEESDGDGAAQRRGAREADLRRRIGDSRNFRTTRGWPRRLPSGQRWREVSENEPAQPASQLGPQLSQPDGSAQLSSIVAAG